MSLLEQALSRVDRWRHLPGYRLEPRADFLFGPLIGLLVEESTGIHVREPIIPEFPVRRGAIYGANAPGANKSVKVDYLIAASDGSRALLVELKTDVASRRDVQDDYLRRAKKKSLPVLLRGVLDIVGATSSVYLPKYIHLLCSLQDLGWIKCPETMTDGLGAGTVKPASRWLGEVQVLPAAETCTLDILYIQPLDDAGQDVISFEAAARILEERGGSDDRLVARYLRRWTSVAGHCDPGDLGGE